EISVGGGGGGGDSPAVVPGVKVLVERTQWPAPDDVSVGFTSVPTVIKSHKKPFTAFVPVLIAPDAAPGEVVIPLVVSYQSCNETTCFRPESVTLPVRVTIAPAAPAASSAPTPAGAGSAAAKTIDTPGFAALATGLDRRALADLTASPANGPAVAPATGPATGPATSTNNTTLPPPASVINFGAFGIDINIDTASSLGLVLVTLVALVGGFLLNLMPCVLPVIPIKIIGLQQAAHNSRARMIIL
ncbi:MAG: hypothetical protein MUE97_03960, partial [Phycisphaerales bacterium]|nr:hypothetical protein [Phycisphaerales bacterium]